MELEQKKEKKKEKRLFAHLPFLNTPSETDQGLLIDKLLISPPPPVLPSRIELAAGIGVQESRCRRRTVQPSGGSLRVTVEGVTFGTWI